MASQMPHTTHHQENEMFTLSTDIDLPKGSAEFRKLMPELASFLQGGGEIVRPNRRYVPGHMHLGLGDGTTLCGRPGEDADHLIEGVEYQVCDKCARKAFRDA